MELDSLDMPMATEEEAAKLVQGLGAAALRGYQHLVKGYLGTCWEASALSCDLASTWIQTGLALTPFAFSETRYSVWALAWAMLGEWTIHHLFPPLHLESGLGLHTWEAWRKGIQASTSFPCYVGAGLL